MTRSVRPLRVMYVVPDLGTGGAERHVTTLMPRLDPARFTCSVVCIGICAKQPVRQSDASSVIFAMGAFQLSPDRRSLKAISPAMDTA